MHNDDAALGFTVKSGWAAAVVLAGPVDRPQVVDSRRLELSDPKIPDARQPYHAGFGTAREAGLERARLVDGVKRFGTRSVAHAIAEARRAGRVLRGGGIVVGSLIDPERIANAHIRIHALEGQLFREVIVDAARECLLPCAIWRDRDLQESARGRLRLTDRAMATTLAALGRDCDGPWRAEQKMAALAAWMALV
jgi:hypothetical protein